MGTLIPKLLCTPKYLDIQQIHLQELYVHDERRTKQKGNVLCIYFIKCTKLKLCVQ